MSSDLPVPFKMFGLQRSGTNLMVALMLRNFHVHSLEFESEWKHGPVLMPERQWKGEPARFVLCVKNPYAWALSCYRYFQRSYRVDPTVAPQFRANPSMSFEEFLIGPSYGFPSPVHRWNLMHRLWLNTLPPRRTALARQEDQLVNQAKVLESVERQLGLKRRTDQLQLTSERIDVNAKPAGAMDRSYYLHCRYLTAYSRLLLDQVNCLLDRPLMKQLDYVIE